MLALISKSGPYCTGSMVMLLKINLYFQGYVNKNICKIKYLCFILIQTKYLWADLKIFTIAQKSRSILKHTESIFLYDTRQSMKRRILQLNNEWISAHWPILVANRAQYSSCHLDLSASGIYFGSPFGRYLHFILWWVLDKISAFSMLKNVSAFSCNREILQYQQIIHRSEDIKWKNV